MTVAGGVAARGGGDSTTGVSQPLTELLSRRSPPLPQPLSWADPTRDLIDNNH